MRSSKIVKTFVTAKVCDPRVSSPFKSNHCDMFDFYIVYITKIAVQL